MPTSSDASQPSKSPAATGLSWYRIVWRKKSGRGFSRTEEVVFFELPDGNAGAFQSALAELPGKVVSCTKAKAHSCTVCGKTGPWMDGWGWYGSYEQIDNGDAIVKTCSEACMDEAKKKGLVPKNIQGLGR